MEEVLLRGTLGIATVCGGSDSKQDNLLSDLQSHFVHWARILFSASQQDNWITSKLVACLCYSQERC